MSNMDPSGSQRLAQIEEALTRIQQAIITLIQQGDMRITALEEAGGERLDQIEAKLDQLLERIG